jgi:hypothetical protein
MVRSLILALIVLSASPVSSAQQPAAGPKLPASGPTWQEMSRGRLEPPPVKVEPDVLDLGDLLVNTKTGGLFRITNTGSETIWIETVMSTCWCTAAEPSSREIPAGATVDIPATFDSGPYIQNAQREMLVRFHGYTRGAALKLKAQVHYGIRASVEYTPPDQRRLGRVTLESPGGDAFDVLSADGLPPRFLDGFDPERDDPRSKYTIAWDLSKYEAEKIPPLFAVETSDEQSPMIDLPVENFDWEPPRGLMPWKFNDFRILLGRLDPATSKDIVVTVGPFTGSALDAIEDVWVEPPVADVRIMGTEATPTGLNVRLRITPKSDLQGPLVAAVQFSIGAYQEKFWLVGRVAPATGSEAGPEPMPQ